MGNIIMCFRCRRRTPNSNPDSDRFAEACCIKAQGAGNFSAMHKCKPSGNNFVKDKWGNTIKCPGYYDMEDCMFTTCNKPLEANDARVRYGKLKCPKCAGGKWPDGKYDRLAQSCCIKSMNEYGKVPSDHTCT